MADRLNCPRCEQSMEKGYVADIGYAASCRAPGLPESPSLDFSGHQVAAERQCPDSHVSLFELWLSQIVCTAP